MLHVQVGDGLRDGRAVGPDAVELARVRGLRSYEPLRRRRDARRLLIPIQQELVLMAAWPAAYLGSVAPPGVRLARHESRRTAGGPEKKFGRDLRVDRRVVDEPMFPVLEAEGAPAVRGARPARRRGPRYARPITRAPYGSLGLLGHNSPSQGRARALAGVFLSAPRHDPALARGRLLGISPPARNPNGGDPAAPLLGELVRSGGQPRSAAGTHTGGGFCGGGVGSASSAKKRRRRPSRRGAFSAARSIALLLGLLTRCGAARLAQRRCFVAMLSV